MSLITKFYYSRPIFTGRFVTDVNTNVKIKSMRPLRRYTMAAVYDDSTHTIKLGYACCQPCDNFCKKIGRTLAYEHALHNPFYVITNFSGRRNDYADEVLKIMIDKETSLRKSEH